MARNKQKNIRPDVSTRSSRKKLVISLYCCYSPTVASASTSIAGARPIVSGALPQLLQPDPLLALPLLHSDILT